MGKVMSRISLTTLVFSLGLMNIFVMADSSGNFPGYVYTPTSGFSILRSSYGRCVHSAYWESSVGLAECGEAPKAKGESKLAEIPQRAPETQMPVNSVLESGNKPSPKRGIVSPEMSIQDYDDNN